MMKTVGHDVARFARLQIRLLQLVKRGVLTIEHLRWFLSLTEERRDAYLVAEALLPRPPSLSPTFAEFSRTPKEVGTVTLPADFDSALCVSKLVESYKDTPLLFDEKINVENFGDATASLRGGSTYKVFFARIKKATTAQHCLEYLQNQKAVLAGIHGLALITSELRENLPEGRRLLSFDEHHLADSVGERGIPIMTLHTGETTEFRLGSLPAVRASGEVLVFFVEV